MSYLPDRDAQIESERRRDAARSELTRKLEEARALASESARQEAESQRRSEMQARYQSCVAGAELNYNAMWAGACKRAYEQSLKDRAGCNFDPPLCNRLYPIRDASPNCTLFSGNATSLNSMLEKDRNRCLEESKIGLQ